MKHIIVLPNISWVTKPGWQSDYGTTVGLEFRLINPLPKPWNPLAGKHPFLQGMDVLRALKVLIRHRQADAVVSVFESGALVLLLLRRMFLFRPKIVLWDVANDGDWKLRNRVLDYVMPRVDGVMCLTSCQHAAIVERWALKTPPQKVYYCIEEKVFAPAQPDEAQDYVLAVGKDISRDYPTLLEAVAPCDLKLVAKTSLPLKMPDLAKATLERVTQFLDVESLRDLYAKAQIVVLPLHESTHPGGITTLFEAMAVGKPLVATDSPSIRDFVRHGDNALVVPCGNPVAMRDAILRLRNSPDLRNKLSQGARKTIAEQFSSKAFAERFRHAMDAWVQS